MNLYVGMAVLGNRFFETWWPLFVRYAPDDMRMLVVRLINYDYTSTCFLVTWLFLLASFRLSVRLISDTYEDTKAWA